MEKQPPQALRKIYSDIARADKKTYSSLLAKQELEIHSAKVLCQALDILGEYGETHQESIGVGTTDGSQQVCYFETPIVTVNVDGKKTQLTIFTSTPFYLAVKDKIRMYSTDPTLPEKSRKQLFSIGQFGMSVVNWLGESANIGQIKMASVVLSFMQAELSKNHSPRSQRSSPYS